MSTGASPPRALLHKRQPRKLQKRRGQNFHPEQDSVMDLSGLDAHDTGVEVDIQERHHEEIHHGQDEVEEEVSIGSESEEHGIGDQSVDELAMRRHLADVESSFVPDTTTSPGHGEGTGVDDTFLELGKPAQPDQGDLNFSEEQVLGSDAPSLNSKDDVEVWDGRDDSGLPRTGDDILSSPSQSIVQSERIRNKSGGATSKFDPIRAAVRSRGLDSTQENPRPTTPGSSRPESKGSTVLARGSPRPQFSPLSGSGQPSPYSSLRFSSRPTYFDRRRTSQRSSISSNTFSSAVSGADDALDADLNNRILGRLPSFGSNASFVDRGRGRLSRGISTTSMPTFESGPDVNEDERPETPRASQGLSTAPTDTVIAKHVQSIQVPETVARDFRARNRSLSPFKQRPSSSGPGTTGLQSRRTLTLKEQNSKIDSLTKENFDLKLKIHFLDQALQSRSEDGVQDLINQNVQFQTDLANERKDSQALRRKVKELERKVREQEQGLADAQTRKAGDPEEDDDDPTLQAEMHEEILYLRQQLDYSENKVTTLTEEVMTKELEKRKIAEHMRSMTNLRGEDKAGIKETEAMWQDLLQAEEGRREQAEEEVQKLREELAALRIERLSPSLTKSTKRRSRIVNDVEDELLDGSDARSSMTLIEQLRHENSELRRDLGAQMSMLTSRARERERLQQEVEDLKLLQRKSDGGRSVMGESIFERSISRAHQRSASRASEAVTAITELERDTWEKKEGRLRDQNAELRLRYQELERTHNTHLRYIATLESDFQEMETTLNQNAEDLQALSSERDDLLQALEAKEHEYEKLEQEALVEIDSLEKQIELHSGQAEDSQEKLQKTQTKLQHTIDSYRGLQGELREITQSVMSLEDEKQSNVKTIHALEQQLSEIEEELQNWEQKCKEIDEKNRKLEITQESLHSEITFLREEQETDKLKIGELEDALSAAQQTIADEQEKMREMEAGIIEERQQRDVLENKSKEEVQKILDDLNTDNGRTKDEVRKLRRSLSAKEVEANAWKQKLEELEQSLRQALGDPNGSKQSLLAEIEKIQRDLETTTDQLDRTKMDLADKDRLLRHRDGLLESTSLESRRLSDLLDKERASRKHELEQFERASKGQATHLRTIAQQETRMLELESAYIQDKRKMASLEQQFRDQMHDRNNLLLALWNRLSTLCGADWTRNHCLVHGQNPSVEVISRNLPAFSKNIIAAIKAVEGLIGSFKVRIRGIEKDLWKDYQTLEHNLEIRMRRMDALEQAAHTARNFVAEQAAQRSQASRTGSSKHNEEMVRLKNENKILKAELKLHRQHPSAIAQQMLHQQLQSASEHARRASSSASINGRTSNSPRQLVNQLFRHHSTSVVEHVRPTSSEQLAAQMQQPQQQQQSLSLPLSTPQLQPNEQRWVQRLKQMEERLKKEREDRLLDRQGAKQRLEEGRLENEHLRRLLDHERNKLAEAADAALQQRNAESEDNRSGVD